MKLQGEEITSTGLQLAAMGRADLCRAEDQLPAALQTPGCSAKPQPFLHQQTAHPATPARWANNELGWELK